MKGAWEMAENQSEVVTEILTILYHEGLLKRGLDPYDIHDDVHCKLMDVVPCTVTKSRRTFFGQKN